MVRNPAIEPLPKVTLDKVAVIVRTTYVRDVTGYFDLSVDPTFSPIDSDGLADFYGRITVAGRTFVEAVRRGFVSATLPWITIKIVDKDATAVAIEYQLWDEDATVVPTYIVLDDHCDINPANGASDLNFTLNPQTLQCAGDINGKFDRWATRVKSTGNESKDASVEFYVTARPLK